MNYRASRTTRFDLSTDRTLVSAEPLTVFGITISNANDQAVEVNYQENADSPSIKGTITVPCKDSKVIDIEFIAHQGLIFCGVGSAGNSSGSNVVVTVYHSHPGA